MIPKPLSEIEWADLEALQQSAREEDETIEYKGSLSGGANFTALSDSQKIKAIDSIAKEAIAFLNANGGDIVIGAREASNEKPVIEAFAELEDVHSLADRLAQAVSAVIEPSQNLLGVRAVTQEGATSGVIIVRARSSLRAPHRSSRKKECYIRRGRESVPMSMDEIQDLTLRRKDMRNDRLNRLADYADELHSNTLGRVELRHDRAQFRLCYIPSSPLALALEPEVLSAFRGTQPVLKSGNYETSNDVFSRRLHGPWKPVLRGRSQQDHFRGEDREMFARRQIFESGELVADFSARTKFDNTPADGLAVHYEWFLGFVANFLTGISKVSDATNNPLEGFLSLSYRFTGNVWLSFGADGFGEMHSLPNETGSIPTFEIADRGQLPEIFQQLQVDLCALAGEFEEHPFSFRD